MLKTTHLLVVAIATTYAVVEATACWNHPFLHGFPLGLWLFNVGMIGSYWFLVLVTPGVTNTKNQGAS